jgi:hypothetical protein
MRWKKFLQFLYLLILTVWWYLAVNKVVFPWNVIVVSMKWHNHLFFVALQCLICTNTLMVSQFLYSIFTASLPYLKNVRDYECVDEDDEPCQSVHVL